MSSAPPLEGGHRSTKLGVQNSESVMGAHILVPSLLNCLPKPRQVNPKRFKSEPMVALGHHLLEQQWAVVRNGRGGRHQMVLGELEFLVTRHEDAVKLGAGVVAIVTGPSKFLAN